MISIRYMSRWGCAVLALLLSSAALAVPIPPAHFVYDVIAGGKVLAGCSPILGTANGASCGSEDGPGYALTSGGIGTPSYVPITPAGVKLGTGTAVDAVSTGVRAGRTLSTATMVYSFEATGPASVHFIPVDVFSTGILDATGNASALLSLIVTDAGTDANIPAGVPDPDPAGPLLDLSALCVAGHCTSDWSGQELTDLICVVNGDNYEITITATTLAAHGASNSASAHLDPVIALDPPYPTSCPVNVPLSELGLDTGPGASTGLVAVPEPGSLSLAVLGGLGIAAGLRRRRVARESARSS